MRFLIFKMNTMRDIVTITRYSILYVLLGILLSCDGGSENGGSVPLPVDNSLFFNPVLTTGPDPWIVKHGTSYYVTHTTGNSLKLYRTQNPSDVANSFTRTVWTAPPTGMNSRNVWAPEIHFINDKWYAYYAADDGNNDNHRMWVLENSSADPINGTWVDKGKLALPDDKWSIDGSIFEHNDQLYYVWSGWEGNTNVRQDIYIVKMSDPLTPTGPRIKISTPDLVWEQYGDPDVNEGPQFLTNGGDKVFIVYSASGCWTDDYSLGLLSADKDADLTDPTSWTKTSQPVFQKNAGAQAYGPGHNSFFKSPDGTEDWIIYHANPATNQGCGSNRSIRMQQFTWNADGTPNFGTPVQLYKKVVKPAGEDID
jgi:GH43 family beta-xylosidase